MMSWTTTSEREEVAELSPELGHIDDRSLSLVEGGGGSCCLSGSTFKKDFDPPHPSYHFAILQISWVSYVTLIETVL